MKGPGHHRRYLLYGSEEWAKITLEALESLNTYYSECHNGFKVTLGWLNQWACSRSFGLGTRLPWDPQVKGSNLL